MEVVRRNESSGTAAASLLSVLVSALESVALETIFDAGKSLLWILAVMSSTQNGLGLYEEGGEIMKSFPMSSLGRALGESIPENKDDGESDEDDEEDEDEEGGDQDDAGEEDYSGEEGNEEDDEEELEANGGGSGDEDEDDDDEDEDGDDEDDDEEDEDEEDEEDEDQPPPKKRK